MARDNKVSKEIYRKHINLNRHINDAWIFSELIDPHLQKRAAELKASTSKKKRYYKTPKKTGSVINKRTDEQIGQLFLAQSERGIYETNIISMVSRTEAFIQDCVAIAACAYPQKLSIFADKGGVPIELVLENEDRNDLIKRYVSLKCEGLMFGKPQDYLEKASNILSIELQPDTIEAYIEIKATRDIVVHGSGVANKIYLEKSKDAARAILDEELPIDRDYFESVVINLKKLSGQIQSKTEAVFK